MQLAPATRLAILDHARHLAALTPPQECAGVITGGTYQPLINRAADPHKAFLLNPRDWAGKKTEAIVHSHPGGPSCPSHEDMLQQMLTAIPWVIATTPTASQPCEEDVFVFGTPPQLDLTAGYRHGVHDCYSLIRGFFAEAMDIVLADIPRGWDWWHDGEDHYRRHYQAMGFRPLNRDETLRRGDVFLARIRAPVTNHAGIWLGDGLILHHLAGRRPADPTRLPRKEPCARWYPFIETWLRHDPRK